MNTPSLQEILWSNTSDAVLMTDANFRIQQANPACVDFTGYETAQLLQMQLDDLDGQRQSPPPFQEMRQALQAQQSWQKTIWLRHCTGKLYCCHVIVRCIKTSTGDGYIVILNQREARVNSLIDPLTGIPNHELFSFSLQHIHAQSQRNQDRYAVVLVGADLNALNQSKNYTDADAWLIATAQALQQTVRDSDILARYDGNIFGLILKRLSKLKDAALVAQMISFRSLHSADIAEKISLGIGIAVYPEDAQSEQGVLNLAQAALQTAMQQPDTMCYFHNQWLRHQFHHGT